MSKQQIIAAAIPLFSANGYYKTSMDEIALQAQVAKGTLYYQFESKAQLFKAIIMDGLQSVINEMEQKLTTNLPIEEQIRSLIQVNLKFYLHHKELAKIFFYEITGGLDAEIHIELSALRQEYVAFIAKVLEQGSSLQMIKPFPGIMAAEALLGMLEGACKYSIMQGQHASEKQLEEFLVTMIISGLLMEPKKEGKEY